MTDRSMMKLGRQPKRVDLRTLKMRMYLTDAVPPPPPTLDYTCNVTQFGVMLNDSLGCCTIAGIGHAEQIWGLNTGKGLIQFPDSVIEDYYSKWDGYVPGQIATDQGGVELDVLNDFRQQGFDGHSLQAYVSVAYQNMLHIKQAIMLFGGVYIGVDLPLTAQSQDVWDVVNVDNGFDAPGSWGGHCVFIPKYDTSNLTCISWGELIEITPAFWNKYVSEAYALLSPDWLASGVAPSGYNETQLMQDMNSITA